MLTWFDSLVEWLDLARRWSRHVWVLRLVMLLSATLSLGVLWQRTPHPLFGVLLAAAALLGVVWARGQLPVVFAAGVVVWAAVVVVVEADGVDVLLVLPVALGLVGWHWAAGALTVAPPWTRVEPAVWRRLGVPAGLAGLAVLGGGLLAWASGFVLLPASLTVVGVVVLLLVVVVGLVLWPTGSARDR